LASPFFNVVEGHIVVNGETATAAEKSLGETLLAAEVPLLRLASHAYLVGRWFFKIKDLRNIRATVWKPLQKCLICWLK
jgi:hypothetical protein